MNALKLWLARKIGVLVIERTPADLMRKLTLVDGLLSEGKPKLAQSQLRAAIIRYRTEAK